MQPCQVLGRRGYAAVGAPAVKPPAGADDAAAAPSGVDPFGMTREELGVVAERMRRCIHTDLPQLGPAADYFFKLGASGKRLRSTILLLLSSRLAAGPLAPELLTVDEAPARLHPTHARRRQQRLAEITELIHVASLLHDDVIDEAGTRRGVSAVNAVFGNKVWHAVEGGCWHAVGKRGGKRGKERDSVFLFPVV